MIIKTELSVTFLIPDEYPAYEEFVDEHQMEDGRMDSNERHTGVYMHESMQVYTGCDDRATEQEGGRG